eukprot:GHVO01048263.1.p2 GENE.GHVO01048263.1~~GHVO01048263.1.p2  ORF type:complete len:106 (-),score=34.80 GHVO01048263.1:796-1113(-)
MAVAMATTEAEGEVAGAAITAVDEEVAEAVAVMTEVAAATMTGLHGEMVVATTGQGGAAMRAGVAAGWAEEVAVDMEAQIAVDPTGALVEDEGSVETAEAGTSQN